VDSSNTPNTRNRRERTGIVWRLILILAGLTALLIAYYWIHKPINLSLIQSLGGAFIDLITVGVIAVIAGGIGSRALVWLSLEVISPSERAALEGVIGLGFMSSGVLILGLLGLYRGGVLWPLLLIVGLILRRDALSWWRNFRNVLRDSFQPGTTWAGFLSILSLFLLFLALLHAVSPPVAWDALTYHLVGPKLYLAAGRINALPGNVFMGFPQSVELLYGTAMSLFNRDTAAAPLHFLFGLFAVLATAGITRRYTNVATARLAPALLLTAYSVWGLFGKPYVDLAVMAYGALALSGVSAWHETRDRRWLIVLGICAGQALSTKYPSVLLIAAIGLYIALISPRQAFANWIIVGLVALVVVFPWLLKGLLLYQNPVYPFIFGGVNWDALHAQQFSRGTGFIGSPNLWQLPILPLAATVFGIETSGVYSFTIGPWLLTAPLLLAMTWPFLDQSARRLAGECLRLGLPLLALWMITAALIGLSSQTRLIIELLPTAAVAGSIGFQGLMRLPKRPLNIDFVARLIVAFTWVLTGVEAMVATLQPLQYLLATLDQDTFIYLNLGDHFEALRQLDNKEPGAQVVLLWEPRSYYCPASVNCIPDILLDRWSHALKTGKTPNQVFREWQQQGISYLILWREGYDFVVRENMAAPEDKLFGAAIQRWMAPVWSNGSYTLYRWATQAVF
jgi:hypothetical protein